MRVLAQDQHGLRGLHSPSSRSRTLAHANYSDYDSCFAFDRRPSDGATSLSIQHLKGVTLWEPCISLYAVVQPRWDDDRIKAEVHRVW